MEVVNPNSIVEFLNRHRDGNSIVSRLARGEVLKASSVDAACKQAAFRYCANRYDVEVRKALNDEYRRRLGLAITNEEN